MSLLIKMCDKSESLIQVRYCDIISDRDSVFNVTEMTNSFLHTINYYI